MSSSAIPKSLRAAVAQRDRGRCSYCGVLQVGQAAVFHIDHVIPRSKSGPTMLENLALQCPHCSLHKSNKIDVVDPASGRTVRLFDPVADAWHDHFGMAADGTIEGRSDRGRATIDALSMNDPWPRSARALQVAAGWLRPTTE